MRPIRAAVVCDYLEEGWPSMDLTGEMVFSHLASHTEGRVVPTRVCPGFRTRFSRLPRLGSSRFAFNLDRLWNRYRDYPQELSRIVKKNEFDLYHVVDHSYAQLAHGLPSGRVVVTCHDLDTFRCLIDPASEPRPSWFRALTQRTLDGLAKASGIACDSDATRSALAALGIVPEDRLVTIHLGTHPECTPAPNPEADARVERLLGPKAGVELLHVGSNIPRKRIDVLIDVLAGIRAGDPRARLVKVGGTFSAEQAAHADRVGVSGAIAFLPYFNPRDAADRATLAAVYRRADLMLQPSSAEGFGLPLAEAIGCGTPMIASDLPVLREVAEEAAEYRAVGDVAGWVESAQAILAQPEPDRRAAWELRSARLRAKYRWEHHARSLADLYERVLSNASLA